MPKVCPICLCREDMSVYHKKCSKLPLLHFVESTEKFVKCIIFYSEAIWVMEASWASIKRIPRQLLVTRKHKIATFPFFKPVPCSLCGYVFTMDPYAIRHKDTFIVYTFLAYLLKENFI